MVVEADESDRSFLYLLPTIAVVTNIDREHLDHYRDLDEIAACLLVSIYEQGPILRGGRGLRRSPLAGADSGADASNPPARL